MKNSLILLLILFPVTLWGEIVNSGYSVCTIYHATKMNICSDGGKWGTYQKCDIQLIVADMGFGEGVIIPRAPKPILPTDGSQQTFYLNVQYLGVEYNNDKSIKTKYGIGKGCAGMEEGIRLIQHKNGQSFFYTNVVEKKLEIIYMIDSVASYQVTHDINIVYKGTEKTKGDKK